MAVREQQAGEPHRTLRELLPVTAVAVAAALGVAVIVTPAVSYFDGSLSGLVDGIPNAVSAPVNRLLNPDDISVRVRPRNGAPPVALVEPDVAPLELVTGRLGATLVRRDGRRDTAGAAAAGVGASATPVLEIAVPSPPSVTSEVTPPVALVPPSVSPIREADPGKVDDLVPSDATERKSPSRDVRTSHDRTERSRGTARSGTFSTAGIRSFEDASENGSRSSRRASSGSARADDHKRVQGEGPELAASSGGTGNGSSNPGGGDDAEPKTRNSKPEKR